MFLLLMPLLAACGSLPASAGASVAPKTVAATAEASTPAQADLSSMPPKPVDAQFIAQLEPYIADVMQRMGVPGAAVAIVQNGKMVYEHGFGVRELGKPDPVTPETLFMTGSTGKSMTTMMMATVVDDGKMRWDTPAVSILPSFAVSDPGLTPKITMRDFVCNCTGIQRHDTEILFNTKEIDAEGALGVVRSLQIFGFSGEFGKSFGYSNQMVASGGYLAALAASGGTGDLYTDYVAQMQQRVFDPIGMPSTTYSFEKVRANPNHATPHGRVADFSLAPNPLAVDEKQVGPIIPAGGAWSNVQDQARYLMTQLNQGVSPDGRRVVSAANLMMTWQPQIPVAPEASYGLGWVVTSYKGARWITHLGETPGGFSAQLSFLPDTKLGFAILTNAQEVKPFIRAVNFRILELAFGQPMEQDAVQTQALAEIERQVRAQLVDLQPQIEPAAVAPYLGRYTNPTFGEIELTLEGDKLGLDISEFVLELRSLGQDNYIVWNSLAADLPVKLQQEASRRSPSLISGPESRSCSPGSVKTTLNSLHDIGGDQSDHSA